MPRRLLLATAALSTAIGCGGGKKQRPEIFANPKGSHYDKTLVDAGVDAAPADAAAPEPPAADTNPKGAFHEAGPATPPATR